MPWFRKYFTLDKATDAPPPGNPPADPPINNDPPKDPPNDQPADPPPQQTVTAEEHAKTLKLLKDMETDRDKFKTADKDRETQQLRDNNRWKEVAELAETERDEVKTENENIKKALLRKEKMSSIRNAALLSGIKKEALDDLDLFEFPEVQIETTSTGNVNVVGAQSAIESLKLKKPYLFGKKSGKVNGSLPEVVEGGKITVSQVIAADTKARKSGSADDKAAYARISKLYNQQQRGR